MQVELRTRVITAAILIGVVLGLGLLAAFLPVVNWGFAALSFLISGVCAWEFASFSSREDRSRCLLYFITLVLPPAICLFLFSSPGAIGRDRFLEIGLIAPLSATFIAAIAALLVTILAGRNNLELANPILRDLFPAMLLIGFGGAMMMSVALLPKAYGHVFWLVAVVAANDTAAYFGGKAIGGPKLAPAISPNKTISGSLFGLAGGLIVGVLLSFLVPGGATQLLSLAQALPWNKRFRNTTAWAWWCT